MPGWRWPQRAPPSAEGTLRSVDEPTGSNRFSPCAVSREIEKRKRVLPAVSPVGAASTCRFGAARPDARGLHRGVTRCSGSDPALAAINRLELFARTVFTWGGML